MPGTISVLLTGVTSELLLEDKQQQELGDILGRRRRRRNLRFESITDWYKQ
jgi:hypothetical protein